MLIGNNPYTFLTRAVNVVQNPALPVGTLIEEIPCDIGRSYEGYKRGGLIEGAEKLRKEVMAAVIWLFGMPVFRMFGDKICELALKIPMNIDYSNAKEGNDAIKNSVEFLRDGIKSDTNLDTSELKNVSQKIIKNLKNISVDDAVKRISFAKKATSISALVLNCVAMGVILPKFNQKLTRDKLKKINKSKQYHKFDDFETFKSKLANDKVNNPVSFKGLFSKTIENVKNYGLSGFVTYNVENNNVFRLCATDIPMTTGRVVTSRNKYEGFENFFMDAASMYFYNFCASHVQKALRKKFNIPNINPANVEKIMNSSVDDIKSVIDKINCIPEGSKEKLKYLFEEDFANELYKQATYGKYGKINRFVKNSDINSIDESIITLLKQVRENCCGENGSLDTQKLANYAKKVNMSNSKYLAFGLATAIFGLAILVPKLTFWITRKITGRNEFTGIADYSDLDKKNKNKNVNKN